MHAEKNGCAEYQQEENNTLIFFPQALLCTSRMANMCTYYHHSFYLIKKTCLTNKMEKCYLKIKKESEKESICVRTYVCVYVITDIFA